MLECMYVRKCIDERIGRDISICGMIVGARAGMIKVYGIIVSARAVLIEMCGVTVGVISKIAKKREFRYESELSETKWKSLDCQKVQISESER